jgi:hypothetical protein
VAARRLVGGVSDEKANADRDESGGVGIVFDELLQEIMPLDGGLFDRLGAFRGCVRGLAIRVLHGAGGLIHHTLRFGLGAAGNFADAFLDFAAEITNGPGNTIIALAIRGRTDSTFPSGRSSPPDLVHEQGSI